MRRYSWIHADDTEVEEEEERRVLSDTRGCSLSTSRHFVEKAITGLSSLNIRTRMLIFAPRFTRYQPDPGTQGNACFLITLSLSISLFQLFSMSAR